MGRAREKRGERRELLQDRREIHVPVSPERAFRAIARIGGATGWYAFDWLWRLRGAVDRAFGGPGMSRGRRHPEHLQVGDVVDCWRVVGLEPGRRLVLLAEMQLPGRATLELAVDGEPGGARIRQVTRFEPDGLAGRAYWYGVYPLHAAVFGGMLRGIARVAVAAEAHHPTSRSRTERASVARALASGHEKEAIQ